MKFLIILFVTLILAGIAFADDPGERDSIIVETVFADSGQSTVDIRIFATSDDSVCFYNFPVIRLSPDSAIHISQVTYHSMLRYWDVVYDTLLYDPDLLRMLGWCDVAGPDNPPLITNNIRAHCWTISFSIDSLASAQTVIIDTTYDYIHGSLLFGLIDGMTSFSPVFIPGVIYYNISDETTSVSGNYQIPPSKVAFINNYPNPFNASTTIEFTLSEETEARLSIYNILGQKVAVIFAGIKQTGPHSATWDAGDVPSGVYFARLESGDQTRAIKMVLLR
jgi:hypothetical protein